MLTYNMDVTPESGDSYRISILYEIVGKSKHFAPILQCRIFSSYRQMIGLVSNTNYLHYIDLLYFTKSDLYRQTSIIECVPPLRIMFSYPDT